MLSVTLRIVSTTGWSFSGSGSPSRTSNRNFGSALKPSVLSTPVGAEAGLERPHFFDQVGDRCPECQDLGLEVVDVLPRSSECFGRAQMQEARNTHIGKLECRDRTGHGPG